MGNARRWDNPRHRPGNRRSFRSKLGHAGWAHRLPARPPISAAWAHSKDLRSMNGVPYRIERSTRAGRVSFVVMLLAVVVLLSVPAWAGRAEMRLLIEVSYYLALASLEPTSRICGACLGGAASVC